MSEEPISIELLNSLISYDPDTGALIWKPRPPTLFSNEKGYAERVSKGWNKRCAGKPALDAKGEDGRLSGRLFNKALRAHVAAYALHHGIWPASEIDHENGDPSDNRILNLRAASHHENMLNRKVPANNKSGCMGVAFELATGKWRALITRNGKRVSLGRFQSKAKAIEARKAAEAQLGFHPNHNRNLATGQEISR